MEGPGEQRPEIGEPGSPTDRARLRVPGKTVLATGGAAGVVTLIEFTVAFQDPDWTFGLLNAVAIGDLNPLEVNDID